MSEFQFYYFPIYVQNGLIVYFWRLFYSNSQVTLSSNTFSIGVFFTLMFMQLSKHLVLQELFDFGHTEETNLNSASSIHSTAKRQRHRDLHKYYLVNKGRDLVYITFTKMKISGIEIFRIWPFVYNTINKTNIHYRSSTMKTTWEGLKVERDLRSTNWFVHSEMKCFIGFVFGSTF